MKSIFHGLQLYYERSISFFLVLRYQKRDQCKMNYKVPTLFRQSCLHSGENRKCTFISPLRCFYQNEKSNEMFPYWFYQSSFLLSLRKRTEQRFRVCLASQDLVNHLTIHSRGSQLLRLGTHLMLSRMVVPCYAFQDSSTISHSERVIKFQVYMEY